MRCWLLGFAKASAILGGCGVSATAFVMLVNWIKTLELATWQEVSLGMLPIAVWLLALLTWAFAADCQRSRK